jgi:proteasome component ECM29
LIFRSPIQLPALGLLQQLRAHGDSQLLMLMNSKFLRIALWRTVDQNELETVIKEGILKDISKFLPSKLGAYLFHFLLHALLKYELPRRGTPRHQELRSTLGITDGDGDRLALYLGRFLLLTPLKDSSQIDPLPGVTAQDRELYMIPDLPDAWDPDKPFGLSLNKAKARILDFAETATFTPDEKLWVFLFAIPETNSSAVSDRGTSHFKAIQPTDPEDPKLIVRLLDLYRGGIPPALAPPISLQTRILGILSKSKVTIGKQSTLMNYLFESGLADETGGLVAKRFNAEYVSFMVHYLRLQHADMLSKDVASAFIARIRRFITEIQGWPIANPGSNMQLRGSLYQLLGIVLKEARLHDLETLMFLLASLNDDNTRNDILLSIEEALSSATVAFAASPLDPGLQADFEAIIQTITSTYNTKRLHRSCFYIISRLANRCLPYSSSVARSMNVRISGSKVGTFEAVEEARKGLDPNWFKNTNSYRPDLWKRDGVDSAGPERVSEFRFPSFSKTLEMFLPEQYVDKMQERNHSSEKITAPEVQFLAESARKLSIESPDVFATMIQYTHRLLMVEGLATSELPAVDEQWERAVSRMLSATPKSRTTLKKFLT